MNNLKAILISILIGFVIGMWFGVNVGKGKPIISNPFAEDIPQKIKQKVGEKIEKLGGDIKGTPKKPAE